MYTTSQQNELASRIGNWINPRLNKLELMIALVLFVSLLIQVFSASNNSYLIVIPLLGFATAYFFSAFAEIKTNTQHSMDLFFHKLAGFGSTIVVVGVMFRIMFWPGYNMSLSIGLILLIITMVYMMIRITRETKNPYFSVRCIVRLIVLLVIGGFLLFAENKTLIEIGISNL